MQPSRAFLPCAALVAMTFSALAAPDEDLLGKKAGYPIGTSANWFYEETVRVGSFSNLDKILPHNTLTKAASPVPLLGAGERQIKYRFKDRTYTLDDFLARQRITGLLLIKNGEVLMERYQYNRNASNRFLSNSMAKSIVSLAVGMALSEKKIGSLDDMVSQYEPRLAGSLYGETSIRNLLRMSSGVQFIESYDGNDDLNRFSNLRYKQGSIDAVRAFNIREAGQGSRFHYASSETVVLALLLRAVTGTTLSDYMTKRLWQPMGAEADATWAKSQAVSNPRQEASMQRCAIGGDSACCSPMRARAATGKSCLRIICLKRPMRAGNTMRSRQGTRLRISDTAISFGSSQARSEDLLCSASTANRSSSTRSLSSSW
jgi:CubicO group peptidase (beta-lactamase class C family)